MVKPENVVAVAAGVVLRRGRILLIRRNFEPFVGCWGMPGGKIHTGEHVEEAVVREVYEETGIRSRFRSLCGILSEKVYLKAGSRSPDMHYLVLASRLEGLSSRITPSREGEVRWFQIEGLESLRREMIPSDYLLLQQFEILPASRGIAVKRGVYLRCTIAKRAKNYQVVSFY